MALNPLACNKLKNELNSCTNIFHLIKLILKANHFDKCKLLISIIIITSSIIIAILLCRFNKFSNMFNELTSTGLTVSIGLVALIIAGYSIIMGTLTKDNLYFLLLSQDENKCTSKSLSFYTSTIVKCTEPLLWFTLLLTMSILFKVLYLIKDIFIVLSDYIIIIKITATSILVFLIMMSIISLVYFILNIYNVLAANAKYLLLESKCTSSGQNMNIIFNELENSLNKRCSDND